MKNNFKLFIEDLGLLILSIAIFLGGIFLLSLKIPFWSLFLGIASIQIGIVLIILTFDAFLRKKGKPITDDYKMISCLVCGKLTEVPKYVNTTICDSCQVKVATTFKASLFVMFALISLTTTIFLVGQNQEIRKKAFEPLPTVNPSICQMGIWFPESCRCSSENQNLAKICKEGYIARTCSDQKNYCCITDDNKRTNCKEITP